MASGSKTDSVFTGNSIADGESAGMVRKEIGDGQSILSAYPMDNVHGVNLPNTRGGSLYGGPTNLEHSLKGGVSAVQDGPGARGPVKHQRKRGI